MDAIVQVSYFLRLPLESILNVVSAQGKHLDKQILMDTFVHVQYVSIFEEVG